MRHKMDFTLRPATAEDMPVIRSLVWQAKINPSGLKWPRFIVATLPGGDGKTETVVGCGQVKPHVDGTRELASIVVTPEWQGKGVASAIIRHLLEANPGEMTLMCLSSMGPFYEKFGFSPMVEEELTPYLRRVKKSSRMIEFFMPKGESLLMMRKGAD